MYCEKSIKCFFIKSRLIKIIVEINLYLIMFIYIMIILLLVNNEIE